MKHQTVHAIKEIVRFFIGCYNRGNATTANTKTVHAEICKQLKITRQANRNNHYGLVVECLRLLKSKIVLFETTAPKENDVLHEIVTVDNRRIYGLTSAAEKYLTDPVKPGEEELQMCSDKFITRMLQHFDVLPQPAGQQTETDVTEEEPSPIGGNNVERLVVTVRNRSHSWSNKSTPADLLGGLYALSESDPAGLDVVASAAKLDWPESRKTNYAKAADFLRQHGLITPAGVRVRAGDKHGPRSHGFKITPLGVEVAIAGAFTDARPQSERGLKRPCGSDNQKTGNMLKGQKQEQAPPAPIAAPAAEEMLQTISELKARLAALENQQVVTQVKEPEIEPVYYSEQATMSLVLREIVPKMVESLRVLLAKPESEHLPQPTHLNANGLYLTLTEVDKALMGIKAYISECMFHDTPVDMDLLEQYAASFGQAAAELDKKHTLPIMGEKVMVKRFLTGDDSIRHPMWKRPVPARV